MVEGDSSLTGAWAADSPEGSVLLQIGNTRFASTFARGVETRRVRLPAAGDAAAADDTDGAAVGDAAAAGDATAAEDKEGAAVGGGAEGVDGAYDVDLESFMACDSTNSDSDTIC